MSGVIQVDDKYIILFCEGYTKPVEVEFAKVRDLIYEDIREKKQRLAMADYFEQLQKRPRSTTSSPARAARPAGPAATNRTAAVCRPFAWAQCTAA